MGRDNFYQLHSLFVSERRKKKTKIILIEMDGWIGGGDDVKYEKLLSIKIKD